MSDCCPDCTDDNVCGNFHVYVIELKRKVLIKEPNFPYEGDTLPKGKRVYYVGKTQHSIECRYKQHVSNRKKKSRKGFMCNCFGDEPKKRPFTKFNKPGKYIKKYHKKGGLRPAVFFHLNPAARIPRENSQGMMDELNRKALDAETDLALTLRKDGHAVHYN